MKKIIKNIKGFLKGYLSTNILFMTFVSTSLINSTLLRFLTVKNFTDIKPIVADFSVILIIGAFGYLIRPKNQFKYFVTWSFIFTAMFVINSMYYTNYMSFGSLSLFSTSLQIIDVGDAVVQNVIEIKDFSFIWAIVVMFLVNHKLKKANYYEKVSKIEKGFKRAAYTLVVGGIMIGLFISTLTNLEIGRFTKQWNREFIVMKFGMLMYQFNDIFISVRPQITPFFGYDKNAKEFREYYESRNNTPPQNEYTDIFKGRDIISIHAESIQGFTLGTKINGVEVTPNLNKIAKEGLYFSNFYPQDSVGTSSDSEFTLNTSLMPSSSGTVAINYWNRYYTSIPNLLKDQGYYSFSMHGNSGSFWNRLYFHAELGYDRMFHHSNDFEIDEVAGFGLTDKSFFRQAVPKIEEVKNKYDKFYGTFIMLTNHTPFTDVVEKGYTTLDVTYKYQKYNPVTKEYEEATLPYLEGTVLGDYFKSVNYADQAIGQFIEDLDKAGLLDNAVVMIYGDHDAKLKRAEYRYYYNYDPETDTLLTSDDPNYRPVDFYDYELNRKVPFIIWTKDIKFEKEITKVMGMIDVMPTIGNMLGIYNKYALGNDIFSIDENVVVFPNSDWLTNKMYYSSQRSEGKILRDGETVSSDYIEKYNNYADKIITVSNAIITYDLIRKTSEKAEMLSEYEG